FCSRRRRHTRFSRDWCSDFCSSDLAGRPRWAGASRRRDGPAHRGRPVTGRRAVTVALVVVSTTTMSGCDWTGLNSLPLPGTAGGGPDAYSVTVQLADVTTLDRNARVRVGDVTVGRIADIELGPGFAEVTVDLDGEVSLPRNATARVGQSSLLGASHLELSARTGEPAEGTLRDGDLV